MKRRDFIRSLLPLVAVPVAPEILVAQPTKVYSFLRENPLARPTLLSNVRRREHVPCFDSIIRPVVLPSGSVMPSAQAFVTMSPRVFAHLRASRIL